MHATLWNSVAEPLQAIGQKNAWNNTNSKNILFPRPLLIHTDTYWCILIHIDTSILAKTVRRPKTLLECLKICFFIKNIAFYINIIFVPGSHTTLYNPNIRFTKVRSQDSFLTRWMVSICLHDGQRVPIYNSYSRSANQLFTSLNRNG